MFLATFVIGVSIGASIGFLAYAMCSVINRADSAETAFDWARQPCRQTAAIPPSRSLTATNSTKVPYPLTRKLKANARVEAKRMAQEPPHMGALIR
jgi:hypothetical protein